KQSALDCSKDEDRQIVARRTAVVSALRKEVPNQVRPNEPADAYQGAVHFYCRLSGEGQGSDLGSENRNLVSQAGHGERSDYQGDARDEYTPGQDVNPALHEPLVVIPIDKIEDR